MLPLLQVLYSYLGETLKPVFYTTFSSHHQNSPSIDPESRSNLDTCGF